MPCSATAKYIAKRTEHIFPQEPVHSSQGEGESRLVKKRRDAMDIMTKWEKKLVGE